MYTQKENAAKVCKSPWNIQKQPLGDAQMVTTRAKLSSTKVFKITHCMISVYYFESFLKLN